MNIKTLSKFLLCTIMISGYTYATKEETRCGEWDNWDCCAQKCINADEIKTHRANIKELCVHKANIEKLWNDLIATDALFAEKARIDELWSKKACAYILNSEKAKIDHLLSDLIYTDSLHANKADLEEISANKINSQELSACKAEINKLWAKCANIENLNVSNNVILHTKYRAGGRDTTLQPYTLGTDILFDAITYDENNNVTQGTATTYTAPESGFYIVSIGVSATDLTGGSVLPGTPVNHPALYVNGARKVQTHMPALTFSNFQSTLFTSMVHLNAGDLCTFRYSVRYIDPVLGEIDYPGTVNLVGAPIGGALETFFAIHYLSSDTAPLEPCDVNCKRFDIAKPCIPPCCPCPIEKPKCELNCHDHGCCNNQCQTPCNNHDDHDDWHWNWDKENGQH